MEIIRYDFHGDKLSLIEHNGEPYARMKPIAVGMGLDWEAQRKTANKNAARWGTVLINGTSKSGVQAFLCIPVRKLAAWLASINPKKVHEAIRGRVMLYQEECDNALWNYWTKGVALKSAPVLSTVEDRRPLAAEVSAAFKRVRDAGQGFTPHAKIWTALHDHFSLTTIGQLPKDKIPAAIAFLKEEFSGRALPTAEDLSAHSIRGYNFRMEKVEERLASACRLLFEIAQTLKLSLT